MKRGFAQSAFVFDGKGLTDFPGRLRRAKKERPKEKRWSEPSFTLLPLFDLREPLAFAC